MPDDFLKPKNMEGHAETLRGLWLTRLILLHDCWWWQVCDNCLTDGSRTVSLQTSRTALINLGHFLTFMKSFYFFLYVVTSSQQRTWQLLGDAELTSNTQPAPHFEHEDALVSCCREKWGLFVCQWSKALKVQKKVLLSDCGRAFKQQHTHSAAAIKVIFNAAVQRGPLAPVMEHGTHSKDWLRPRLHDNVLVV